MADLLFTALKLNRAGRSAVADFSRRCGVPVERLLLYNDSNLLPPSPDLEKICATAGLSPVHVMLAMGRTDHRLAELLRQHADEIAALLADNSIPDDAAICRKQGGEDQKTGVTHRVAYKSTAGTLYQGDCLSLLPTLPSESVDLVFADPPFNLKKLYPSGIDDDLRERQYIQWCENWLTECIRVLKFGGSLLLWNLPRWNAVFADFLAQRLTFRHWIAVDIKYSLPIPGRLYPSHYSLLYFVKGAKPSTFHPDRLPMEVCPKCAADLRDYGGYKDKMNPKGVNLPDVWFDIPPVRHARHKKREGANELSIRLLDRIIEMTTDPGDVVLDPFGGAGTTYAVAEMKGRRWIGIEIGPVTDIVTRLEDLEEERCRLNEMRAGLNQLFTRGTLRRREQLGLWTHETVRRARGKTRVRA